MADVILFNLRPGRDRGHEGIRRQAALRRSHPSWRPRLACRAWSLKLEFLYEHPTVWDVRAWRHCQRSALGCVPNVRDASERETQATR